MSTMVLDVEDYQRKKYLSSVSFRRSKESHCLKLLFSKTLQKHMSPKSVFFEGPYLPDEIALDGHS